MKRSLLTGLTVAVLAGPLVAVADEAEGEGGPTRCGELSDDLHDNSTVLIQGALAIDYGQEGSGKTLLIQDALAIDGGQEGHGKSFSVKPQYLANAVSDFSNGHTVI
jgi:hypothetical protein